MSGYRVLRSERAWWVLSATRVSRLVEDPSTGDGRTLRSDVATQLTDEGHRPSAANVSSYGVTVLTSTDCNLRCPYCFQNETLIGDIPRRITATSLAPGAARQMARFARARMNEAGIDCIDLLLFGGEPLLSIDACVTVMEEFGKVARFRCSATTNGVLLRGRRLSRLIEAGLGHVQITFDGPQADHDSLRRKVNGGGTYARILDNIEAALQSPLEMTLRVNVTSGNSSGIGALLNDLARRFPPSRVGLYFAPVTDPGLGFGDAARRRGQVAHQFVAWYQQAADLGFLVSLPTDQSFCGFCTCQDGRYGFVAGPDGILYSSWETAGKPEFAVGNVWSGYDDDHGGRWRSCGFATSAQADALELARFHDLIDAARLESAYQESAPSLVRTS